MLQLDIIPTGNVKVESDTTIVHQRTPEDQFYEDCQESVMDACPTSGRPGYVVDNPVAMGTPCRAFYTTPFGLAVGPSGNWQEGLGVWSTITIPEGVYFGPFEGDVGEVAELADLYNRMVKERSVSCSNSPPESYSNWMKFVNHAKAVEAQNLTLCLHKGKIYFQACRSITPAEELLLGYKEDGCSILKKENCLPEQQMPEATVAQDVKTTFCDIIQENKMEQHVDNMIWKATTSLEHFVRHKIRGCPASRSGMSEFPSFGERMQREYEALGVHGNITGGHAEPTCKNAANSTANPVCENIPTDSFDVASSMECDSPAPVTHTNASSGQRGVGSSCTQNHSTCAPNPPTRGQNLPTRVQKAPSHDSPFYKKSAQFVTGKKFKCDYCGQTFSQRVRLKNHLYTHTGEKPHVCLECGHGFSTKSNLNVHERIHTGSRPYVCCFCGKGFYRGPHLKVHLRCHTGEKPYKCDRCGRRFADGSTLKKHKRSISGCVKLKSSEAPFKRDLDFHPKSSMLTKPKSMQRKAEERKTGGTDVAVDPSLNTCGLNGDKLGMQLDIFNTNGLPQNGSKNSKGSTKKKIDASHKATAASASLRKNTKGGRKNVFNSNRAHPCGLCNKTFKRKHFLTQHMRTHSGEKPHSCRECGRSFTEKSNLNEHLRIHTGERPFVCSFCEKGFYRSSHLKVHIRCHTGEKPYKCEQCSRTFADCSTFRRHKMSISACSKTQFSKISSEETNTDSGSFPHQDSPGTQIYKTDLSSQQTDLWDRYPLISQNGSYVNNVHEKNKLD